jgi:hypothetical protein
MTVSALGESDSLHERALGFVRAFECGHPPPEPFDALACDVARFQAAHDEGQARLFRAHGITPSSLKSASEVPAVPTDAFKVARVASFPPSASRALFRTSGTTAAARGTHEMRRPESYDAASLAFGRWALVPEAPACPVVLVLHPSPAEAPDSSLARMTGLFAERLGAELPSTARTFLVERGVIDLEAFDEQVAIASVRGQSVLLLATSFALVHLLDALGGASFRLPPGSRVMQTGGFKGRSREVDGAALRAEVAGAFAIEPRYVVGEYGMTELSSQFYEATLRGGEPGVYVEPPWARVVAVDPDTLEPVADGEVGIARVVDLINVDSAVAVLTSDRVRRREGGFELLGRSPGAPPRGCSIALDDLLGSPS